MTKNERYRADGDFRQRAITSAKKNYAIYRSDPVHKRVMQLRKKHYALREALKLAESKISHWTKRLAVRDKQLLAVTAELQTWTAKLKQQKERNK